MVVGQAWKQNVTTMKLEEAVLLSKHGAVARFSLWKFSVSWWVKALERQASSAVFNGGELMAWCQQRFLDMETLPGLVSQQGGQPASGCD